MIDFSHNHFELFGLPVRYRIDPESLEHGYRALQRDVHPDRFAGGGDDARHRVALQASARVNEAYVTLKSPVDRGRYLLTLAGIDALDETDTTLPLDFLEAQLERREAADEALAAGDMRTLDALLAGIRAEAAGQENRLAAQLDANDLAAARGTVRELTFLHKVAGDVAAMADALMDRDEARRWR
jgi:molecular chaperone HscB